jgi:hypothetical protein
VQAVYFLHSRLPAPGGKLENAQHPSLRSSVPRAGKEVFTCIIPQPPGAAMAKISVLLPKHYSIFTQLLRPLTTSLPPSVILQHVKAEDAWACESSYSSPKNRLHTSSSRRISGPLWNTSRTRLLSWACNDKARTRRASASGPRSMYRAVYHWMTVWITW